MESSEEQNLATEIEGLLAAVRICLTFYLRNL